jgi:hypothetical protein
MQANLVRACNPRPLFQCVKVRQFCLAGCFALQTCMGNAVQLSEGQSILNNVSFGASLCLILNQLSLSNSLVTDIHIVITPFYSVCPFV